MCKGFIRTTPEDYEKALKWLIKDGYSRKGLVKHLGEEVIISVIGKDRWEALWRV